MGHVTGFLDHRRADSSSLPVAERLKSWREFLVPMPEEELCRQGARCMDCGVPFCHATGCPVFNLIPEWNDLVYRGDWREAFLRLEMTNTLPEITGRVCPAPCETACTLAINTDPVSIKQIELAIVERAFAEGWVAPRPPRSLSGKRVAVVGSGPAGLAAAQQLRRAGHEVTVYERSARIGGLLRYGIPDFKLEKAVIDRRIRQMEAEGVRFEAGVTIGEDISARYLRGTFDVVLLAVGAGEPRDLQVPGRELSGIHFAMDYLTRSNRALAGEIGEGMNPREYRGATNPREYRGAEIISARGKSVLVIGGGDTGSDCVGTANRQGARSVCQYEILPRPMEWKEPWNPSWPLWPNILRTSSSHEEGCDRDWAISTTRFEGAGGRVKEAHLARVVWSTERMEEVPGSGFSREVDLVLLAMGFLHPVHSRLLGDLGVAYDRRGNILCESGYATSVPGVFAAGDAGTGASLVVHAIFHGREAARSIDRFLRG